MYINNYNNWINFSITEINKLKQRIDSDSTLNIKIITLYDNKSKIAFDATHKDRCDIYIYLHKFENLLELKNKQSIFTNDEKKCNFCNFMKCRHRLDSKNEKNEHYFLLGLCENFMLYSYNQNIRN